MPASWPAKQTSSGSVAEGVDDLEAHAVAARGGGERDVGRHRPRARRERVAPGVEPRGVGGAGVDPQPDGARHGRERVRLDLDPRCGDEEVRVAAGQLVGRDDDLRGGRQRVATLGPARRARVVGAAGEGEREPRPRGERADRAGRGAEPLEVLGLVDVQLEEPAQPRQPARRPGEPVRVRARGGHRVGERDAVVVAPREHVRHVEPAGQRPRAERRRVEARALLVGEGDHRDAGQPLGHREPGGDAERAVEPPAAAHAVEVRAGRPPRPVTVRQRPQRPGRVAGDPQAGGGGLVAEPRLGGGQLLRPRQARDRAGVAEPRQPVAQLVRADHDRTRHAWSGRTQASSPPTITAATGLCPKR